VLLLDGDVGHGQVCLPSLQGIGVGDIEGYVAGAPGAVRWDRAGLAGGVGIEEEEHVPAGAEEDVAAFLAAHHLEAEAPPELLGGAEVVNVEGGFVDASEGRMEFCHTDLLRRWG
jgi:hypothetical protein